MRQPHIILLASVALLSGCATDIMTEKDRAMMAGRYGVMEKHAEAEVADIRTAKTVKLAPLCFSYAKLKRYGKLGPCLDQLEKNVAAGDTNMADIEAMEKKSPLMMGLARFGSAIAGDSLEQDVTAHLWEVRAETYMDLGEYGRAVEYGRKMVEGIPKKWNLERYARIHAVGVLGLALAFSGDRAAALERARELEAVSTAYPYVLLETDKQVLLARLHVALGNYQKAYEIVSKDDNSAFRGLADIVSGGSTLEGGSLLAFQQLQRSFMLHKSELETGRFKEAKAGYDGMLANPATRENGDFHWIVLYDRGRIAEHEGNAREAVEFFIRAVEVIERERSSLNTEASKIGFIGSRQKVYQDLVRALVAQDRGAEAFEYVERAKSRALVDMLASKKDFTVSGGNAEQVKALLAMADSAEAEARVLDDGGKAQKTRGVADRARSQLAEQAPELASLVSVTALDATETRQRLRPAETLVEYYYGAGRDELYAFIVNRDGIRVHTLDGAGLGAEVQALRKAIGAPDTDAWRAPAQRLHERLVKPVEASLGEGRVTVVAHGALHYLPFNALFDGKRFLIERHELRMLPAASVLKFLKAAGGEKPGMVLALGNPDLGNPRYDLEFAQAEARAIAASMPRSRALTRKEANKAAFRQYASGFRFLHIASHGLFDAEAPLNSALLLSPDAQDSGRLTVGELYSMRVDADLVTLSACETGLGKIESGDDLVGLTRGFLYAGASAVVASLWQVDDQATGQLMAAFYDALRGGAGKSEALRSAQLKGLRANPHPYFWAAFQLTGS
ncbi:MAG: CHAT domain-containing protein [Candidatus Nitricoxidivorans perseverans]|uniref:CHAT domain-containing protein n=1 Tax=Candidatus Nitricoxidivorans perseverans TaxID=2975601 RepID=A0AA49IU01_9PROT|nr:MAG: CHAT domain-containing protein [Candidatus Nitricoxidivorans perseverans]